MTPAPRCPTFQKEGKLQERAALPKCLPSKLCEREDTRLSRFWPTIRGAVPVSIVCVRGGVNLERIVDLSGFDNMHPYHGVVSFTTRLIHGHCPGVCGVCIRPFRRRTFFSTHLPPHRKLNGRLHIAAVAELTIPELEVVGRFRFQIST